MRAGQAPIHGMGLLPCPLPGAGRHTAVGLLDRTVQSWESHLPSPNPPGCHGVFTKHSEGTTRMMKMRIRSLSKEHYPKAKIPEGDSPQLLTGCVTQGKSLTFSGPCFPIRTVRLGWDDAVLAQHVVTDTLLSSVPVARIFVQSKRDPPTRLSLSAP